MKTLLLAAFIGFLSVNSYGQNKCHCTCKNETDHKTAGVKIGANVVHHGTAPGKDTTGDLPPYILVLRHVPNTIVPVLPEPAPCYSYTQHDIVVKECPGTFYDRNGVIQFNGAGTYSGYYPDNESNLKKETASPDIAPQHTVISPYKGTAPADGNSCVGCMPK